MKMRFLMALALVCSLAGCGSDSDDADTVTPVTQPPSQYIVGGAVTGLSAGKQVLLRNGDDALTVTAEGKFSFAKRVTTGSGYKVTIGTQPDGQTCTVSSGEGAGVNADVSSIQVTCSTTTYLVNGTVSGLAPGRKVVLANNGGDNLEVSVDGSFAFAAPIAHGSGYNVTVVGQPSRQTCSVSGYTGSGVTSNVASIRVLCATNTYRVGGSVGGLSGSLLTLQLNGAESQTLSANGAVNFNTKVAEGGSYNVTVLTQPVGQICTVFNGSGTNVSGAVSFSVSCVGNKISLYVTNSADPSISQFQVTADGTLSPLTPASVFSVMGQPRAMARIPQAPFVLVTGAVNILGSFPVDGSGGLGVTTDITGAAILPQALVVHPQAPLAYVLGTTTVSSVRFTSGGALSGPVTDTVTAAGPAAIAVHGSGKFVYIATTGNNQVAQYSANADGSLSNIQNLATPPTPHAIVLDYSGKWGVVATSAGLHTMEANAAGALSITANYSISAQVSPYTMAASPIGPYIYVVADSSVGEPFGYISVLKLIEASGSVTATVVGTPIPTGLRPRAVTVDPTGRYVYVVNNGENTVSQYRINADGSLSPLSPATVAVGASPTAITAFAQ
ncbi:beta-propeller fold lactonase family protein [Cupriavidus pauculus]|uniref:lactonase family protein n=1 Tax=Cupriavidus pauculus TaxID=82633 RepID=UPI001EE2E4D9|nr:beta-propeller fold lactonase family protein [Cupriavidus pauculus]GJG98500.1 beta-propeller fold lactonase family protein [Cupriavidus pauculus]